MSDPSLDIQEISSRTFNPDYSLMETSLEHAEKQNIYNFGKYHFQDRRPQDNNNHKMIKRAGSSLQQICHRQQREIEQYKLTLKDYVNRVQDMEKSSDYKGSYEMQIKQLMEMLSLKDRKHQELEQNYNKAIYGLKETIDKNQMLFKEVDRLSRKLQDNQLNYNRQQQFLQKSQNLISNLSVTKSNYEIEIVSMKDSLVVMERENKKIAQTNQQYQEKLALLSQQIERLRGVGEISKKESEHLAGKLKEQQELSKRMEYQTMELRGVLERLRMQNREATAHTTTLSSQMQEYHQKMIYKDSVITDLQQREGKATMAMKDLKQKLQQLEIRFRQSSQALQEEVNNRKREFMNNQQIMKEVNRVRAMLNDSNSSAKQIELDRQQLYSEHQNLAKQYVAVCKQRDQLLKEGQRLIQQKETLLAGQQQLKMHLKQCEMSMGKMELINQQKASEFNSKSNEVNQLKLDLTAKISQNSQIRQEILSQNSVLSAMKREYQQKLAQRMQLINDLKQKLNNYQRLLEQNRKQRDMICQEKNSIVIQTEKSQHLLQMRGSELKNSQLRADELIKQVRELSAAVEDRGRQVEKYRKFSSENQRVIKELRLVLNQGEKKVNKLAVQLERLTDILHTKQITLNEVNTKYRETMSALDERKAQLQNLRTSNQKISMTLSRVDESKSNFQLFLKEIDRLNKLLEGKESEITTLQQQLSKLIYKIQNLGQQQLKIIKILQSAYSSQPKKDDQLSQYFKDLKSYIERLNHNTTNTLHELSQQGSNIYNQINQSGRQFKNGNAQLQDKLTEAKMESSRWQQEATMLKRQLEQIKVKAKEFETFSGQQRQVFEKLLELGRENASLREQMMRLKGEYQNEMQLKGMNVSQLESQLNTSKLQSKQLQQLKRQMKKKQKQLEQVLQRQTREKEDLVNKISKKEQTNRILKEAKQELEGNLQHISSEIDQKLRVVGDMQAMLMNNGREMERYRQIIRKYQMQDKHSDRKRNASQKQVQKLQKILQIRNSQIAKNEQSFKKVQRKNQILEKQLQKCKDDLQQARLHEPQHELQTQYRIKQLQEEKDEMEEKNSQCQRIINKLELTIKELERDKKNGQSISGSSRREQKGKSHELQLQIATINVRIDEGSNKINQANQQIHVIQQQLYRLVQNSAHFITKIEQLQTQQASTQNLKLQLHRLQDELQNGNGRIKQLQIENGYLRLNHEQSKIFLHQYEYKTAQLDKQYKKLKEILTGLNTQNSNLQTKNHYFEVQLKKAEILQQKIQVLNGQINRLSLQNIDLNQEISSCKLAISNESTIQRRVQQQLILIVLLMAEVQALRNRVKEQEQQVKRSRVSKMSGYRN